MDAARISCDVLPRRVVRQPPAVDGPDEVVSGDHGSLPPRTRKRDAGRSLAVSRFPVGATRRLLNFLSLGSGSGKPGCGGR